MSELVKILCVDDERNVLKALERIFLDDDYEIITGNSGEEGLELLEASPDIQVVISDYRMPGMNGVEFLKEVYSRRPDTVRIVLSGYADTAAVVAAINEGQIYKFVPKPWNDDELRVTVAKAIETISLHLENRQLADELSRKNEELSKLNSDLEKRVMERSTELVLQNRILSNFRNILNNLPVGVIGLSSEGSIAVINHIGSTIIGIDPDSALGNSMEQSLPEEFVAAARQTITDGALTGTVDFRGKRLTMFGTSMNKEGQDGTILVFHTEH